MYNFQNFYQNFIIFKQKRFSFCKSIRARQFVLSGGLPLYDEKTEFVDTLDERIVAKLKEMKGTPREFSWTDSGAVTSVKNQVSKHSKVQKCSE